ncbi:MAG: flagellar basal body P-ring formation protein FlgA [Candidatus Thiodiazotropha sp. (ex Semelilucina semeliformis)]|nr:flagellar basal body P-ring formation protein FlgA [Candidatus Thiodiazotropha sp. (ex Semelilucina semeliformis)]MCU7827781.1 flagellar basal body P-ring formation protein FlgA [Candidatus Thiodiazotropha sp. (ex Myrtea sp. 'scaly one' KF741663)]
MRKMSCYSVKNILLAILLLFSAGALQASDSEHQPHESIISAVENRLAAEFTQAGEKLVIAITPLDHRLKLARCETSLETFDPPGGISLGRTTVGVSCQLPKPWTLYVSANVGREMPVAVAQRDLSRGTPIGPDDLSLEIMNTSHLLRGHFSSVEEINGRTLKRTLRRGQVVTPSMLVVQKTVRRGEQITILAGAGPIEVRSRGKALRDGNPGDLIPVLNLASKKKLEARVVTSGLVSTQ